MHRQSNTLPLAKVLMISKPQSRAASSSTTIALPNNIRNGIFCNSQNMVKKLKIPKCIARRPTTFVPFIQATAEKKTCCNLSFFFNSDFPFLPKSSKRLRPPLFLSFHRFERNNPLTSHPSYFECLLYIDLN